MSRVFGHLFNNFICKDLYAPFKIDKDSDYINDLKMKIALELLSKNKYSIKEISNNAYVGAFVVTNAIGDVINQGDLIYYKGKPEKAKI